MSRRCILSITCVLVFIFPDALRAEDPPALDAKVQKALTRLNAPDFKTREKASEELADLLPQARPLLENALAQAGRLTDEQRDRVRSILKDGKTAIWERRSGLAAPDVDLLRHLRETRLKRQQAYEQMGRVEQLFSTPELTDQGVALIVWSLCSQIPSEGKDSDGFEPWQLGQRFSHAMDVPVAGPATAEAYQRWVDVWLIPGLRLPREQRSSSAHHQDIHILTRLLVSDSLPADQFGRLWRELLLKFQKPGERMTAEYGLSQWFVLGLAHSRHVTRQQLGELLTALLYTAESPGSVSMSYGYDSGVLRSVIASAALDDAQARSLGDWLIAQFDAGRPRWNVDDLLQLLTGTTMWRPNDPELRGVSHLASQQVIGKRWREWWAVHRDSLVSKRAPGASHRCVSVLLQKRDGHTKVSICSDTTVREGSGRWISHPERFGAEWILMPARASTSVGWSESLPADMRRQLLMVETSEFGSRNSGWSSGSRTTFEGDVVLASGSGWVEESEPSGGRNREKSRGSEAPQRLSLRLLLPEPSPVTVTELQSVEFWEERLIETAVRCERREEELSRSPQDKRPGLPGMLRIVDGLERCRTQGLEKRVEDLQKDTSARVASAAGLVLAKWELKSDRDRMLGLLKSEDAIVADQAGTALTLAGGMEGIGELVERAGREGPTSKMYAALNRCAEQSRLTPEQRMRGAVLVIERLLPNEEKPERAAVCEVMLARRWSGQDFGYRVGASVAENTTAMQRYHEWAKNPTPATQTTSAPAGAVRQ